MVEQRIVLIRFQGQHITRIPTGHDGGLTAESHVTGKGGAQATDIGASCGTIIPPQHLLTNPTRDGQADLAVALAGSGGLKLSNTLLKIGAAVIEDGPN